MAKPKILLIPDMPGWAFDRRADYLKKYLSKYYTFEKKYYDFLDIKKVDWDKYDCVFFFFWGHKKQLHLDLTREKICTGVFSFTRWQSKKAIIKQELKKYKAVVSNNPELADMVQPFHPHVFLAPNGVDETVFYPIKPKKNKNKFIVGWVGNPDFGSGKVKGYHDIIVPTLEKMPDVELRSILAGPKKISHKKLNIFYNQLDVCICASLNEATPNPVMEASAAGVPIITTKVGITPLLIKDGYNGLFIKRNKTELKKAIRYLQDNEKIRNKMGINARREILKNWTYEKLVKEYKKAFDFVIYGK